MNHSWQLPVSQQNHPKKGTAHLLPMTRLTDRLVPAYCGRRFNPGFAVKPLPGSPRCKACLKRSSRA